jgi:hypothetical protein
MRTEFHVVGADERGGDAKSLHGVCGGQEQCLARLVNEFVADVRVVHLAGVLPVKSEAFIAEGGAGGPSGHVLRDFGVRNYGCGVIAYSEIDVFIGFLELADDIGTYAGDEPFFLDHREHLPERELQIRAANVIRTAYVRLKVVALDAPNALECDALVGGEFDASTEQTVVDAQLTVFVGSQCQSVAELFVEITCGHRDELVGVIGEEIFDALPLIPNLFKIDEREHVELVSHTSRKTTVTI